MSAQQIKVREGVRSFRDVTREKNFNGRCAKAVSLPGSWLAQFLEGEEPEEKDQSTERGVGS